MITYTEAATKTGIYGIINKPNSFENIMEMIHIGSSSLTPHDEEGLRHH